MPAAAVARMDAQEDDRLWLELHKAPRIQQDDLSPEEWLAWDDAIQDYQEGRAEIVPAAAVVGHLGGRRAAGE